MRRKLAAQDYLGVIEAMRAASRVPPRQAVSSASTAENEDGGAVLGWAPTEETYALALEACGKVCALLVERGEGRSLQPITALNS